MSAIKRFFQKRKLDVKFKKAGEGHKLTDDTRSASQAGATSSSASSSKEFSRQSSNEAQRAAQAAVSRMNNQASRAPDPTMAAKARMRREMELEKKKDDEAMNLAQKYTAPKEVEKEGAPMTQVLFHCPEIGPLVLPKHEMEAHIHEFLLTQLADEPEMTSALMIHTLNKDKDKVKICIETLCKYLDNIMNNPGEEKFRKIRVGNKAFQERVASLNGTEEFMQAAGFVLKSMSFEEREEPFYVMEEELASDVDRLKNIKEVLNTAEPLNPQLDRNLKVYHPSNNAANFSIPEEFYTISPTELKKEQQRKQEAVEQLGMLRTKAMREREERREIFKYRYTLVRIRFPEGVLIQGTFKATEKLPSLTEFVREQLQNDWMPFILKTQMGNKLDDNDKALAELGLTPAALINFEWDKEIMAEITAHKGSTEQKQSLKPEVTAQIQDIRI